MRADQRQWRHREMEMALIRCVVNNTNSGTIGIAQRVQRYSEGITVGGGTSPIRATIGAP